MQSDLLLSVRDDLDQLSRAYQALELLSGSASADSDNVSAVLSVLNKQFESVISGVDKLNVKGGVRLVSVNR